MGLAAMKVENLEISKILDTNAQCKHNFSNFIQGYVYIIETYKL